MLNEHTLDQLRSLRLDGMVRAIEEQACSTAISRVAGAFVPVQLPPAQTAPTDIRVELRRGPIAISVSWPCAAASECAAWMRELLR